jgi:transcriptional regulator with XRE-family HTH domain
VTSVEAGHALPASDQASGEDAHEWVVVGGRIREARTVAGISVRELARRIDVSPSHVSQVERGLAAFSVRALYNVVSELGIQMDSLFDGVPEAGEETLPAEPPRRPLDEHTALDTSGVVLRATQRPTIKLKAGPRWERLTAQAEEGCEFLSVVYEPNPSGEPPEDFIRHSGREYGVVIAGELNVQVGFGQATLGVGDSIAFDSSLPHRFWNAGAAQTRCVWFVMNDEGSDGVSQHN